MCWGWFPWITSHLIPPSPLSPRCVSVTLAVSKSSRVFSLKGKAPPPLQEWLGVTLGGGDHVRPKRNIPKATDGEMDSWCQQLLEKFGCWVSVAQCFAVCFPTFFKTRKTKSKFSSLASDVETQIIHPLATVGTQLPCSQVSYLVIPPFSR